MSRFPVVSSREAVATFGKLGYEIDHQTGSHVILRRRDPPFRRLTVPNHKEIARGALRSLIVAEVRKAREEFARQFNDDLHAMCEELRREEKLSGGGPLVSLPKRPAQTFPAKRPKETTAPAS